jgi:NAD(P)-dependent dehydrogenase (short-subunit alcohol dehydrogenase family)
MPSLLDIRNSNATLGAALRGRPVAVFVGGTAGIGAGMAKAFAEHRKGDAHIVIVGRNRQAAQELIASFPKPAGGESEHEFVECDVTLMRNVQQTTSELVSRLPKVNFLVLSPGILTTKGRNETDEGIDKKLALHYYARWRFTYECV